MHFECGVCCIEPQRNTRIWAQISRDRLFIIVAKQVIKTILPNIYFQYIAMLNDQPITKKLPVEEIEKLNSLENWELLFNLRLKIDIFGKIDNYIWKTDFHI